MPSPAAPAPAAPSGIAHRAKPALPASPAVTGAVPQPAPGERDAALAAERSLLEIARTALNRGDARATLAATQRHAAEFPRGELAEESGALEIQALVGLGRTAEAQAKALEFHQTFPKSLFWPALQRGIRATE
jgi:hypothetical protein